MTPRHVKYLKRLFRRVHGCTWVAVDIADPFGGSGPVHMTFTGYALFGRQVASEGWSGRGVVDAYFKALQSLQSRAPRSPVQKGYVR